MIYFTTSTINKWIKLFHIVKYRKIILDSLNYLINNKIVKIHGYVIMPNHIHLLLTILEPHSISNVLRDFHKYTSQQIIKLLRNNNSEILERLLSDRNDRKYQIWQTSHAVKQVESADFFRQKLEYIHNNPCTERWQLCEKPEDYQYSSASDYLLDIDGPVNVDKISMY